MDARIHRSHTGVCSITWDKSVALTGRTEANRLFWVNATHSPQNVEMAPTQRIKGKYYQMLTEAL